VKSEELPLRGSEERKVAVFLPCCIAAGKKNVGSGFIYV
jgi:hypothetical protein